jgi:very-short-patch-repair endonuclease
LFVLDFYCAAARIPIEVDGMAHDMGCNPERDARRDLWLAGQDIAVIRFTARGVIGNLEGVVCDILRRCAPPLHQPAAGPPPHAPHGED